MHGSLPSIPERAARESHEHPSLPTGKKRMWPHVFPPCLFSQVNLGSFLAELLFTRLKGNSKAIRFEWTNSHPEWVTDLWLYAWICVSFKHWTPCLVWYILIRCQSKGADNLNAFCFWSIQISREPGPCHLLVCTSYIIFYNMNLFLFLLSSSSSLSQFIHYYHAFPYWEMKPNYLH